jgi:hypothetical protein
LLLLQEAHYNNAECREIPEQREDDGAAVRGNREKPMLSHCITKAMVQGWVDANQR